MPKEILVTYGTNAGSTAEVAEAIAASLRKRTGLVQVCPLEQAGDMSRYSAAVIGAPMILGWHRAASGFLKKNQQSLAGIPVAYFLTAISLTRTGETEIGGIPLFVDPYLPKSPGNPSRLSLRENYATVRNYVGPILRAAPSVRPVSIGLFGGKIDFSRLKLLQMLFVMLIIGAQPGDRRNWPAIEEWAAGLSARFSTV